MCRIIFEAAGQVRRAHIEHEVDDLALDVAISVVHQISMWRFVAIERCVWWEPAAELFVAAKLEAL